MSTRDTVLALVADLSPLPYDATRVLDYFEEVSEEIAMDLGLWCQAHLITATAGTAVYTLADDAISILAAFWDDRELYQERLGPMDRQGNGWRSIRGTPIAYITEAERDRRFRLWPNPDRPSQDFIFLFGSPFGKDYPPDAIAAITVQIRSEFSVWLHLYTALRILNLEFSRESPYRDPAFAEGCQAVATVVKGMFLAA